MTELERKLLDAFVAGRRYIHGGQDRGRESQVRYDAWMKARRVAEDALSEADAFVGANVTTERPIGPEGNS